MRNLTKWPCHQTEVKLVLSGAILDRAAARVHILRRKHQVPAISAIYFRGGGHMPQGAPQTKPWYCFSLLSGWYLSIWY